MIASKARGSRLSNNIVFCSLHATFYTSQENLTLTMLGAVVYILFLLNLAAIGAFNYVVLQSNLCSPRFIVTIGTVALLGLLVVTQCIVNCLCFPCASKISTLIYCAFFVVLGIALTAASSQCNDPAQYWAYGIDAGIIFLIVALSVQLAKSHAAT